MYEAMSVCGPQPVLAVILLNKQLSYVGQAASKFVGYENGMFVDCRGHLLRAMRAIALCGTDRQWPTFEVVDFKPFDKAIPESIWLSCTLIFPLRKHQR